MARNDENNKGVPESVSDADPLLVNAATYGDSDSVMMEYHEQQRQQTGWQYTAFIIAGETLGTGVMGLPKAVSQVGYVVGISACVIFGFFSCYSGVLLSRVRNDFAHENIHSYSDAARLVGGRAFELFTQGAIVVNWLLLLPYFLMAGANSLYIGPGYYADSLCYYEWAAIILLITFLPVQLRTLHEMRIPALLSIAAVVIVLGTILIDIAVKGKAKEGTTSVWPVKASFLDGYEGMSSFVFAYQGQSMFFEIMREMKVAKDFPKAVTSANFGMGFIYTLTAFVAYYFKGNTVSGFLPESLTPGPLKTFVGIILTYHVLIAYLLTNQPLAERFHRWIFPSTLTDTGFHGKLHWAIINGAIMVFAYLIANAIPFFADFQNIIGAGLGAPILFGWPVGFYLLSMKHANRTVPTKDKILCFFFLVLICPFCIVVGLVAAGKQLASDWSTFGLPFSCTLAGYS